MSKYTPFWQWIAENAVFDENGCFTVSFEKVTEITDFPIDHAFLAYKKELVKYSYLVKKISMKSKEIYIVKK